MVASSINCHIYTDTFSKDAPSDGIKKVCTKVGQGREGGLGFLDGEFTHIRNSEKILHTIDVVYDNFFF